MSTPLEKKRILQAIKDGIIKSDADLKSFIMLGKVQTKGDKGDSIKGEQGESIKGEKGEKGDSIKGDKGDTPTKDELVKLIKSLIPKPIKPKDGKDGTKGDKGEPADPLDTDRILNETIDQIEKDIPKLGEPIRDSLELLNKEDRLDASAIKGLSKIQADTLNRATSILDQRTKFLINKKVAWGTITGTITDQTDLVTYIAEQIAPENTWDRTGTVLSPYTAGDDISTTGLLYSNGLYLKGDNSTNDGQILMSSGHMYIQNTVAYKDIIFRLKDGAGIIRTITWDSETNSLQSSTGTFDFDNDNLTTSGTVDGSNIIDGVNTNKLTVSDTEPTGQALNDLWVDTAGNNDLDIADGNFTTTGTVTLGGDLIFNVDGSGLPFAEIYARDNATTTSTSTTKAQILIFDTNGASNNMTPDHTNDHITVTKAGKYKIDASISIKNSAGASHVISLEMYKNNGTGVFNNIHAGRSLAAGTDVGNITMSGIVDLAVNDTIEVWITSSSGAAKTVTVEDIDFCAIQIGG